MSVILYSPICDFFKEYDMDKKTSTENPRKVKRHYPKNMSNNKNVRKSAGIACCRFNDITNKLELLVIKKRYTYNFAAFVFGQYSKKDDKRLMVLFNGMTLQEKIDIMSLNFDLLWYKIWLDIPKTPAEPKYKFDMSSPQAVYNTWKMIYKQKALSNRVMSGSNSVSRLDFYTQKKTKFETLFMSDNGNRLRTLISGSTNTKLVWEIPKGRKNKKETSLDCAIREFKEETDVGIEKYIILFGINPVIESYVSGNVKYVHEYFMAYESKKIIPSINIDSYYQISEISDIRWAGIDEILVIDDDRRLYKLAHRIFRIFKFRYRKAKAKYARS